MGAGMADFITRDVVTIDDYDLYCHYVAGLVGLGMSQASSLLWLSCMLEPTHRGLMPDLRQAA